MMLVQVVGLRKDTVFTLDVEVIWRFHSLTPSPDFVGIINGRIRGPKKGESSRDAQFVDKDAC
jgi:hypothetical protein